MQFDGIPRYTDPGSHDPKEHKGPVDPSGKEIKKLRPEDKDIPLAKVKDHAPRSLLPRV